MKTELRSYWVKGVRVTPFLHYLQQSLVRRLQKEDSGNDRWKEYHVLGKIIPSDAVVHYTRFRYEEHLPASWLPEDLSMLEEFRLSIKKDLEDKGYEEIVVKLSRRNQYVSLQWTTRYPPTDHFIKEHSQMFVKFVKAIKKLCYDYFRE